MAQQQKKTQLKKKTNRKHMQWKTKYSNKWEPNIQMIKSYMIWDSLNILSWKNNNSCSFEFHFHPSVFLMVHMPSQFQQHLPMEQDDTIK